ncbi:MAG TPA: APC family permease [Acidimicrobiales bacterium]|jgi:amino acid transporter|nr:APC family permease [Acidimicrobiales bacterium]
MSEATRDPIISGMADARSGGDTKGLKDGAIGLLSNTVIAIASVAPAYSLAAALGFVVISVGLQAPIVMLLAFVPMVCVAFGYAELNRSVPDCGTTFTWGTKAFNPAVGWMGGWGIIAADVIVMANLAQIAGQYMFELFGADGLAASKWWTLLAGVLWIVAMAYICYIGIEISARLQYGLLAIELTMLFIFSVTALTKVYAGSAGHQAIHPALSWFNPFHLSFSNLTLGLLSALFIYWGWDTAVSINEETKDRSVTPGKAAVTSTVVLLLTYVIVTVAAEAFAGVSDKGNGLANSDNSGDVLSILGGQVFGTNGFGWFLAKLLILMVLSSSAASTLTTILPTARTSLAMAVYKAIPQKFARIHARYLTPTWSTVGMAVVSIGFYIAMTLISTNVLGDTISSLGLMIAFYYGLTGITCAWWFRKELGRSARDFVMKGFLPLFGGLVLWAFMVYGLIQFWKPDYGSTSWTLPFSPHWQVGGVFLTGAGAIVVGVILMLAYALVSPSFFRGETLDRGTPVLAPEPPPLS